MDTLFVALRVLVVLAVIVGLLWYVQRRVTTGKRGARLRRGNAVTVVGRQGVGAKASVVVVDVDGTRFVLGVTERAVNVLHSGERPTDLDAEVTQLTPVRKTFAKPLGRPGESQDALATVNAEPSTTISTTSTARPAGASKTGKQDRQDADYLTAQGRASVFDDALKGSILSPATWRQASSAVRPKR
ncbi:FliO/MopB family protein [Leifsonia poae]|uniref:FliO/MopB family protein n=1 Tax=Leifsonia poae TaxID=110933 RepID=UPI001CBD5E3C|nr:flagellar biosynthetic protein FliO [Leifsonia poae]